MKVLISGSTGLLGTALCRSLAQRGDQVIRLARGAGEGGEQVVRWDPLDGGPLRDDRVEGLDAVIHLAGESIAGRWTRARKERIRDSRILGTRTLVRTLGALRSPPPVLLCASAVGFYGDTGADIVDETAPQGDGFLAEVCSGWEQEARRAREASGIRTVSLRLGMVLSTDGGALASMLPPFRLGLGGPVGNGRQWMSWITLEDAVQAMRFLLGRPDIDGPVNLTAPAPVSNRAFTRALGRALHRPACLPLPAFVVKMLLGEMGTSLLLASTGVRPKLLEDTGFAFRHATIESAFEHLLAK